MSLDVDVVATSDGWGVNEAPRPPSSNGWYGKPGCPPEQVLYVGDRIDNDIRPAQEAGLRTAHIRRGPWAYIVDQPEVAQRCLFRLDSLAQLPELLRRHNARA
jgi:Predicted hydrolase (HAD superfamily)